MDSLKKRGEFIGTLFSFLAALIFALLCIFVKTEPKTVYKTIQVQLSPSKPNPQIQSKKTEISSESKKVEKTKTQKVQKSQSASNTQKTEKLPQKAKNQEAKSERPKIRKSIEELMAEQNSKSSSKTAAKTDDWDDSVFDENAAVQSSASSRMPKIASAKSSASGSAGSASSSSSGASASSKSAAVKAASSSTKNALSELENLSFSSSNEDDVKSMTQISAQKTSGGKLAIKMSDGKLRELISPRQPVIYLDDIKVNLDKSKKVQISFDVTESGTVPIGSIEINPASSLTDEIISLIKSEVSTWTFSQGPEGSASFDYTIEIH